MPVELADILAIGPAAIHRRRRSVSTLTALLALGCAAALAKGLPSASQPQSEADQGLTSSRWEIRREAVARLAGAPPKSISAGTRRALISLLESETKALWNKLQGTSIRGYPPQGEAGEWWAEYYASLVDAVARLRDPAATATLVAAADGPGSRLNEQIASLGPAVVGVIRSRLRWLSSVRVREPGFDGAQHDAELGMLDILTKMMTLDEQKQLKPPLTPSNYARIRHMLRPLLQRPDRWVRLYAAVALDRAGDERDTPQFRAAFLRFLNDPIPGARTQGLERMMSMKDIRSIPLAKVRELAASDPYHYRMGVLGNGPVVYPVREAALKVLEKFSKPPSPEVHP